MSRSDAERVADILDAAEQLAEIASEGRCEFDENWKARLAAERLIEIIGEAAGAISPELAEAHPGLPLREAKGMRNFLSHEYWHSDPDELWEAIENDIPAFVPQLEDVAAALAATQGEPQ